MDSEAVFGLTEWWSISNVFQEPKDRKEGIFGATYTAPQARGSVRFLQARNGSESEDLIGSRKTSGELSADLAFLLTAPHFSVPITEARPDHHFLRATMMDSTKEISTEPGH